MDIAKKIGGQIRKFRNAKKLTQAGLAEAVGRSVDAISQFERGKTLPSIETLIALSDTLNVTIDQLLGRPSDVKAASAERSDLKSAAEILATLDDKNLKISIKILHALAEG